MYKLLLSFFFWTGGALAGPDKPVYTTFANPSFEDPSPRESHFPDQWSSQTPNNTPDLLPGAWNLSIPAFHGKTCLGLVTRDDGGVENVGQKLPLTLKADDCYRFFIYLSHAAKYVGYNQPCRLRVWGGDFPGDKRVLLATSPLINHSEWKQYEFTFSPRQDVAAITFEAYYAPGATLKYKGNILLDLCSDIEKCTKA